jgi:hypothetical protein
MDNSIVQLKCASFSKFGLLISNELVALGDVCIVLSIYERHLFIFPILLQE